MAERPTLEQVADRLSQLPPHDLVLLVKQRIQRQPTTILPGIVSDGMAPEDPTDIFIDCYRIYPDKTTGLAPAVVEVLQEWSGKSDVEIQKVAEATGELLFLSANVPTKEAVPLVADFAKRQSLERIILPGGENAQHRALRALSGLLVVIPPEEQGLYRELFEKALDTPEQSQVMIGLNTLFKYWPEERVGFVERARKHNLPETESLIKFADDLHRSK